MFCKYNGEPESHKMAMPCLVGRAGEIRSLGPALLHVYTEFQIVHCVEILAIQRSQIQMALEASVGIDTILEQNKSCFKFETNVYDDFLKLGWTFLVVYNALGYYFSATSRPAIKIFNITVKLHMMGHCILQGKWLNPRIGWCYSGEHMMFKVRRLLSICTKSNGPADAVVKFFKKYRIAMHLLFVKRD